MKLCSRIATAALVFGLLISSADAQLYGDVDTTNQPGAGGAAPADICDAGTTSNWSTNATGSGVPGFWTDFSDAVFAAGTNATGSYTVTLGGTVNANSIAFEEGSVTISGGVAQEKANRGVESLFRKIAQKIDNVA